MEPYKFRWIQKSCLKVKEWVEKRESFREVVRLFMIFTMRWQIYFIVNESM